MYCHNFWMNIPQKIGTREDGHRGGAISVCVFFFRKYWITMSLKIDKWRAEGAGWKERQRKSEITVGLINLKRTLKSRCDNREERKKGREKKETRRISSDSHKRYLLHYSCIFFFYFVLCYASFRSFFKSSVCLARNRWWRKFVNVKTWSSRPSWNPSHSETTLAGMPSRGAGEKKNTKK